MTTKTYRSTSVLSFSITMPAGNYRRIRFTPFSWGGGIYITEDEAEQKILESLPSFGTNFQLVGVKKDGVNDDVNDNADDNLDDNANDNDNDNADDNVDDNDNDNETPEEENDEQAKVVSVADFAEAKDYLIDNYGYKSSQLRSQKAIVEAAEKNGIVFEYA